MFEEYYSHLLKKPATYKSRYTGQYHTMLLELLKCNSKVDVFNLPYKFKDAHTLIKPDHLAWFHSQLEKEGADNINIKNREGTVDPLYSIQSLEIEKAYKKYKVKNMKELLMQLYHKLN